jgi:hypothetical protein
MTMPDVPPGPAPKLNDTLQSLFRNFQKQLDEQNRQTMYSAVISRGGLTIQDGGGLDTLDSNGNTVLHIGSAVSSGVTYEAFALLRPSGTPLMETLIDSVTGQPFLSIQDKNGVTIVAEDAHSGGLALPWLPIPLTPIPNGDGTLGSTSLTSIAVQSGGFIKQQPYLRITDLIDSNSGSGHYTIGITLDGNGIVTAPETNQDPLFVPIAIPGDLGSTHRLDITARIDSGTGRIFPAASATQCQSP